MKRILAGAVVMALFGSAPESSAAVPPNVHIAYPIPGSAQANYVKVSFTVTCAGGPRNVRWGFDGNVVGSATFYDNFNSQFLHKLPSGVHVAQVWSSCGEDRVQFVVH
jgi:hypothetical protein